MKLFRTTRSPEETIRFGQELAAQLTPPKLILLKGGLGAGKTTLVKGIAEGFKVGSRQEVTSPTFTLVHEYRGRDVIVYHIDLYRIETQRELDTIALDDLRGARTVLLIEWGDKFEQLRKEADHTILVERTGDDERLITVSSS
jgi:tRNA threonylcarbamoyladenosine biosynthesis protein TsaE